MATKPIDTSFAALDAIDNSQQALQDQLAASPTAFTDNTNPTTKDLMTQVRLKQVDAARNKLISQKIKDKWYGTNKPEETLNAGDSAGILEKGLDLISTTGRASAGVAKYLAGEGKGNLWDTVKSNVTTEKETYGDLLRKKGVGNWAAAPLGFMLDVAFDPLNWMSFGGASVMKVGTQALVPKIGMGLLKDGIKGAELGLMARGTEMANTAGKFIPGFKKSAAGLRLGEKAVQYGEDYNKAIGFDVLKQLDLDKNAVTMGDRLHSAIVALPHGEDIIKGFQYFPSQWQKASEMADEVLGMNKEAGKGVEQGWYNNTKQAPFTDDITEALRQTKPGDETKFGNLGDLQTPVNQTGNAFIDMMHPLNQEVERLAENPGIVRALGGGEGSAWAMNGEAMIDANKDALMSSKEVVDDIIKSESEEMGKTGVKFYDNWRERVMNPEQGSKYMIKDVPYAAKMIYALDVTNGLFKLAKTALNPTTYVNATMGNPIMAAMFGINVASKNYLKTIGEAAEFAFGKNRDAFLGKLTGPEWKAYAEQYPETFRKTYGFRPEEISGRVGMETLLSSPEGKAFMAATGEDSNVILTKLEEIAKSRTKAGTGPAGTGMDFVNPSTKPEDMPTSFAANELYSDNFYTHKQNVKKIAEGTGAKAKAAQAYLKYLEKPGQVYGKIDETFKLGTAVHLSMDGVTEKELMTINKQLRLGSGDVTKHVVNGETLYKISPKKATEAANEIYLNYAAMPGFVKMMRSVPLLNSPFISFTYGMAHKVAKTAAYNPAFFNKATYAMDEISGQKTPLEKKALESPYYKWYTQPGMVKIPFFQENPVYFNAVNWLPYYSMNLFTPTERKYANTIPGEVAKLLDHTPFMQSPVGQTIFNYLLQPMLIQGEVPQGQFGQPIYPIGASATDKWAYAGRDLAESLVPGVAGYAGLGNMVANLSPDTIEKMPFGFRFRELANAVQGRNVHGDTSTQDPWAKAGMSTLAATGFPVKKLDTTFLEGEVKKGIIK
jgi:hypothetical protein